MKPKKPAAVFEIYFDGDNILPEKIPLATLSRILSAVQHLASGSDRSLRRRRGGEEEDESLRLLDVKRGSAIFSIIGPSPKEAISNLRITGNILTQPKDVGENTFFLNPIEELSSAARKLKSAIVLREAKGQRSILAKIVPESYGDISNHLLVTGETSVSGQVKRVGGVGEMRCGLRVATQDRLLYCKIATAQVARDLGKRLYKPVVANGTACWLKTSWKIVAFTIQSITPQVRHSLLDDLEELREAGGKYWDDIQNPQALIEEIRGDS
jgi:hypothetical protein